ERQRLSLEAEGKAAALRAQAAAEAEATRIRGAAEAEAARLRGLAEAEVIRAKGEAEAEAMRVKAAAYHEYNQAAVLDKVITNLPEMVRAMAEPLAKVDKISIVSTGSGSNGNLGASRVTADMVNMLAQTPVILEALTGVRIADLMARVPGMTTVESDAAKSESDAPAATDGATDATAPDSPASAPAQPGPAASTASGANGTSGMGARGPRRQRAR
ncbi:MAG: hypothetical protein KGO05_04395, partial [Chloroflexota bacterium]|nr:hypothetical protein [Chloroflexota bacterium]